MSEMEVATGSLERHEHLEHNPIDGHARRASVLIGLIAAGLAIADMAGHSAQTSYISHQINASDNYAFYQARQIRGLLSEQTVLLLQQSPNAASPETQKAIEAAQADSKRITEDSDRGNGIKQLQAKAKAQEELRDHALERYELFEIVTSGLQIAIVLASVSVVTRIRFLAYISIALAAAAGLYAAFGIAHVA